ncbi:MAG TPA: iron-sulfur cluster assembly accessory protein [Azospirillum sp.]
MVTLTPSAVATLERVLAGNTPAAKGLRIAVTDGGCAGHKYQMGLEADAGEGDAVFEFGAVRVFIDEASQPLLAGVVVDFVEGIEGAGFKFENPNATGSCGCGKSFSSGSCATPTASGCGTTAH